MKAVLEEHENSSVASFAPPRGAQLEALNLLVAPWRALTRPKCIGLNNVPQKAPALFVGNHTLFGVIDAPLMVLELYRRRGVYLRALGDHAHFAIPLWRDLLTWGGVVDGTRDTCTALMRARQSILVFPGGGREVFKRKGEKYKLIWKERVGFCRLAIEHGYSIVPFGAVGAEEFWDIVLDANDFLGTPAGKLYRRLGFKEDYIAPIPKGIGPTVLPHPERLYFAFGRPISTRRYAGRQGDTETCLELRARVEHAVQRLIADLLEVRRRDPKRYLLPRLLL